MPIQSANPPEIATIQAWKGINQQSMRGTIDDQELYWQENFYSIGPGNLRACWGPSTPIYTAPAGTTILRIFFGYIGLNVAQFSTPPPGRMGFMFLSDGNVDQVDLDTKIVTRIGQVWQPVAPYYWAQCKVWRPQFIGQTTGEEGGVVIGSPLGLFAWDGTVLFSPGDPSPEWLSGEVPGVDPISPMPVGLPGIYAMEVYQDRLWVAGKNVISFSAPNNGANFSTVKGGGSFGYFGDKLVYSYMDLQATAGYLYVFGDSSTDIISNVQFSGQGTPEAPFTTNFIYSNLDPQVGHGFPRAAGRWGRFFIICNGDPRNNPSGSAGTHKLAFRGGIYEMTGGDAKLVGQKVSNIYATLDTSQFIPTMCPMTMFGFRIMLLNGMFTDAFGVTRSMLLAWNGEQWCVMSQTFNLTHIGCYEQDSIITPYGTDGTNLYRLFDHPDPTLIKRLSTKSLRGNDGQTMLTVKNFKRLFLEMHDFSGVGISVQGTITGFGGVPGGVQDIAFEKPGGGQDSPPGAARRDVIEPAPITVAGIAAEIDLHSFSPDFVIERLHVAAEQRTLFGA